MEYDPDAMMVFLRQGKMWLEMDSPYGGKGEHIAAKEMLLNFANIVQKYKEGILRNTEQHDEHRAEVEEAIALCQWVREKCKTD